MSWVSEIKDICGDYYIDIKYHEDQKEAISLFFNSHRNAETVKRCIELDDSVPNVATAVDFVEVVRCKDCTSWQRNIGFIDSPNGHCFYHCEDTNQYDFCSYGEKALKERSK